MHRTEELADESPPSETEKESLQYYYFPRDMYSLEVEIVCQSTEGKVPNQVHNPGDFRLSRIYYLYHAYIATMELDANGCPHVPHK